MKLLYIANARIPTEKAHGIQIMKMCEAFTRLGVDLELVIPKRKVVKEDPFVFYNIKDKFPIKRLLVIDTYSSGILGYWLAALSFAVNSFFYALFKPGVIIYSRDHDQFSFFTIPLINKPYFFEIHGPKEKSLMYRLLFSRIKGIIATNNFNKEKLLNNFSKTQDKIIVLPNSVDAEKFNTIDKISARTKLNLPMHKNIIVYAGHFYRWKGVDTIIQAAREFDQDTLFYLIGGTNKEIKRIKQETLPSNLILVGFRNYFEIPDWYAAADILILSGTSQDNYSFYHTSPVKLYEYMAAQRPIIAVDSPAMKDLVTDQEVFFYQADDDHDLSQQIKMILTNQDLAEQKVEQAYQKVKGYSWQIRAQEIINFIKRQLEIV